MSTLLRFGRTYFATGLALLMAALVLTLAAKFGEGRTSTEVEKGIYTVQPGHIQIALVTFPLVLAASTFVCGLGCIQGQIRIARWMQGSAQWAAAAGVVLLGMMPWRAARSSPFDPTGVTEANWIGFAGTVLFSWALVVNFIGSVRYFVHHRREVDASASRKGDDMTAAKIYARGGLLIVMLVLLRIGAGLSPWRDWVTGLSVMAAGMFTYPLAASLGALSLFLSALQAPMRIPERVKAGGALLYFVGAGLFFVSLYEDLRRDSRWESMSWPTAVGLLLLLGALAINLAGMLRSRENGLPEAAVRAD